MWCGKGKMPKRKGDVIYTRRGTAYECLQKGIGSGIYSEKKKRLKPNSLRHISYLGEVYEKKMKKEGVKTLSDLRKKIKGLGAKKTAVFLKKIFTKSDKSLDKRAYNSTLVYIYRNGNDNIPKCTKI